MNHVDPLPPRPAGNSTLAPCCHQPSRPLRARPGRLLLLACALLLAGQPLRASESYRINDVLGADWDVQDFKISPDGSRVVYLNYQVTNYELYSVPIGGGPVTKLNGPLVSGGTVWSFEISPDGSRVVYTADQDTDAVIELYSVPIGGGAPTKLNGPLVSGGNVFSFQLSPDGGRAVYSSDQLTAGVVELFSVPIGGGTPIKLNGTLTAGGDLSLYLISPNSGRVVYSADQITDGVYELFSVPIGGGTPIKLNGPVAGGVGFGFFLSSFEISPDSSRVVYYGEQVTAGVDELFSVPIGGGTRVKLNGTLVPGGNVSGFFKISANSSRVVYRADQVTNDVFEVFSAPIGGGTPVKLNGAMVAGGDASGFQISPDSTRVVYLADQTTDEVSELFSVPIGGGAPVKLNGALPALGDVSDYRISSNSNRVVFQADPVTDEVFELFSVPIAGGTQVRLNGGPAGTVNVPNFEISPDGSRVAYVSDEVANTVFDLFIVPIAGGPPLKLNGPLMAGGDVLSYAFSFSPDNSRVVYRADQLVDGVDELFVCRGYERFVSMPGNWDTGSDWQFGIAPDLTADVIIDVPGRAFLTGSTPVRQADTLTLGGGTGTSVLQLQSDAQLNVLNGFTTLPGGSIRGSGLVDCGSFPLALPALSEIQVLADQRLRFKSGTVSNEGSIYAFGLAGNPAEIDFFAVVKNRAGTGVIAGGDANLKFQTLSNAGVVGFVAGTSEITGEISNDAGGQITVDDGGIASFLGDVTNAGSMEVTATGAVQSKAVFHGALRGNGASGGGFVLIAGNASPGFSAGIMSFGGDVALDPNAILSIELGGINPGTQYDQLGVTGDLALGGKLNVTLINGFVPSAGMSFDVWNAATFSGGFTSFALPALPAGLFWHTSQVNTTGVLSVSVTPENYAAFAAYYALTQPPTGDDDFDGHSNLEEYGLGMIPNVPNFGGPNTPKFLKDVSDDYYYFDMPALSAPDLELEIQSSIDLIAWPTLATRTSGGPWTGVLPPSVTAPVDGMHNVKLVRPSGGDPKHFYRLLLRLLP